LIDLHTHTTESDGTLAPEELVEAARAAGVETLAITDHDTFEGYLRARSRARELGVSLVCGIEVSTRMAGQWYHVLGFFFQLAPPLRFSRWLDAACQRRHERNARLAARLAELSMPVTVADAEALGRSITGRVHFARVLVERGYVPTIEAAFARYLGSRGSAYVEFEEPDTLAAIAALKASGAVAVLAHPVRYELDAETEVLRRFRDAGLDGIEAIHTDHSDANTEHYEQAARGLGMVLSGGSDFHGSLTPHARLGHGNRGRKPIPPSWLEPLQNAIPRS
jgi:predicted metal-dependent phosphoesterase TrpH